MSFKKWIQIGIISMSVVTLAACSTHRRNEDMSAVNDANASYSSDAQSSGLGDESSFGERGARGSYSTNDRTYYFEYDSNVVHDSDRPAIAANANYLSSHPNIKVMVEGHTDPRGSREYNIGLGERRAKAVAQILAEKGVNPAQIRIVSYGAEKLASSGHNEADFQLDRRVVLVYMQH